MSHRKAISSVCVDEMRQPELELIDDTFAVQNKLHLNEEAQNDSLTVKRGAENLFGTIPNDGESRTDFHRFPPINESSANFNKAELIHSFDPMDQYACDVQECLAGPNKVKPSDNRMIALLGVSATRAVPSAAESRRKDTALVKADHSIKSDSSGDDLSRAND